MKLPYYHRGFQPAIFKEERFYEDVARNSLKKDAEKLI